MRRIIILMILLLTSISFYAQCPSNQLGVYYKMEWNASMSYYEFYVTRCPSAAPPVTVAGTSNVTLVFPNDPTDTRTVTNTNESVSNYNAAGLVRGPAASPGFDYYVFNSTGGANLIGVLNDGVEVLWMTFTPSDGNDQARLFVNGMDPNSSAPGMNGVDGTLSFNILTSGGVVNEFNGIIGIDEAEEFVNLSIFPNPTSEFLFLEGPYERLNSIHIVSITGQVVKKLNSDFDIIDVKSLEDGVYFLKFLAEDKEKIIRFIKN